MNKVSLLQRVSCDVPSWSYTLRKTYLALNVFVYFLVDFTRGLGQNQFSAYALVLSLQSIHATRQFLILSKKWSGWNANSPPTTYLAQIVKIVSMNSCKSTAATVFMPPLPQAILNYKMWPDLTVGNMTSYFPFLGQTVSPWPSTHATAILIALLKVFNRASFSTNCYVCMWFPIFLGSKNVVQVIFTFCR